MNIQISNHNFDLTDSFREYINDKFSALDKYQENIVSFTVILSRDQHHQKGEVYTVEANVNMPAKNHVTIRETSEDARAAVDIVQEKLARQLVKFKDKFTSKQKKGNKYLNALKFWNK